MAYSDQTETIYRLTGEYLTIHSGIFPFVFRVDNIKQTGSVFYNHQENIETKSVGNYSYPYEVLNGVGRRENNLHIRDLSISQSMMIIPFLTGTPYSVGIRLKNKSIFASRFSAPGEINTGPNKLDVESFEYSPYNSINFRNRSVRKQFDTDYQTVMNLDSTSTYTTHKINPNTRYLATELSYETKSDNGFINHQIPYHVDQVTWLTSSLKKAFNPWTTKVFPDFFRENNEQTGSEYYFTSTTFAFDSAEDNSGLTDPKYGSNLTQTWCGNNIYSVYGFNSWTQIKRSNNWKSRLLKQNLYISIDKDIDSDNIFKLESSR